MENKKQMENILEGEPGLNEMLQGSVLDPEELKITNSNIRSIHLLHSDQFLIKDERELFQLNEEFTTDKLGGVYLQGIQYYDLKNINFINNTGMATLIELLKSLLKKEIEVQFVNVNEKIKDQIKSMGLDNILNCS